MALAALVSVGLAAAEVKLAKEDDAEAIRSELEADRPVRTEERDAVALEADPVMAGVLVLCVPVRVVRTPPAPVVEDPLTLAVGDPVMLT